MCDMDLQASVGMKSGSDRRGKRLSAIESAVLAAQHSSGGFASSDSVSTTLVDLTTSDAVTESTDVTTTAVGNYESSFPEEVAGCATTVGDVENSLEQFNNEESV
jgi:hypothetical protein